MLAIDIAELRHDYAQASNARRAVPITALCDVDLEVGIGEWVSIEGPSGAGKTTLLTIIAGLLRPSAGRVRVFDEDLATLGEDHRAAFRTEHVGFVFQMFPLIPYLNVVDNVCITPHRSGAGGAARGTRAAEILDALGLAARRYHRPAQLSAGERQRVGLARALLDSPELLLADEPTGSLDADAERRVVALFDDYRQAGGTILVVSHSRVVSDAASRRLEMRDGCLVA